MCALCVIYVIFQGLYDSQFFFYLMLHHFLNCTWNLNVIIVVLDLYHSDVISYCLSMNIVVNMIHLALMASPRTVALSLISNLPLLYLFAGLHLCEENERKSNL